ncbi:MAG: type II toxin-antitoxin system Xre/ParS family antitoxin [Salibacteraceae bacterium]
MSLKPFKIKENSFDKLRQNEVKSYSDDTSWSIDKVGEPSIVWNSPMDRLKLIREGLPFETIDAISKKSALPIKRVLSFLGLAQTTYNKKKREQVLMDGRDSELILVLSEVLQLGTEVFNNESQKFQRWLIKPNPSLGGVTPESLFDSLTGIEEVKNALYRLEYGNMA